MTQTPGQSPLKLLVAALGILLVIVALACGRAATATPPPPASNGQDSQFATPGPDGITPILATRVLEAGRQRVSFLLADRQGLIQSPQARLTATHLGEGEALVRSGTAAFHLWPYGIRGAYSADLDLDRVGEWQLEVLVDDGGTERQARLILEVTADSPVPNLGSVPPRSETRTLASAGSLEQLTTDFTPDAELYQLTVREAIESGVPSVIVFATPAFCTSATCGPQVDTVTELKEVHRGRANFVHVEVYANPHEIQGDLSRAVLSEAVHEWGISEIPGWFNESWTFVLDSRGTVSQRFEGYATLEELEVALQAALAAG